MSLFRSLFTGGLAAALGCAAGFSFATPKAPSGWTVDTAGRTSVYRMSQGPSFIELRLFAQEETSDSLGDWFKRRVATPVQGVASVRMDSPRRTRPDTVMSTGEAIGANGRKLSVVRSACKVDGRPVVYAEILSSTEPEFYRSSVTQAAGVFSEACIEAFGNEAVAKAAQAAQAAKPAPAAAASAPAKPPYKYVAAKPGTGLRNGDIEAVLHSWAQVQHGMSLRVVDYLYLLLKDGTYLSSLPPVAFEDFDVAASKAGEPGNWGRWKKSGSDYSLTSPGRTNDFSVLSRQSTRDPARRDERLDGTWTGYSAYSTGYSVAQSRWGVTFERNGRFSQYSGGSISGNLGSQAAGNAVHAATVHDDDSSSSSVGSANFGGGSTTRRKSTEADRSGTYRLDGYLIELRYDSGRVVRSSFYTTGDRKHIWFEGNELDRKDAKSR